MLAGAWTLQVDGHVRADIFYTGASPRWRALVDLIGAIVFRLVFCGLGGDAVVERALTRLPGGVGRATLAAMAALFLLGFVMDAFDIISSWCRSCRRCRRKCPTSIRSGSAS